MQHKDCYAVNESQKMSLNQLWNARYPIQNGLVQNWDDFQNLYKFCVAIDTALYHYITAERTNGIILYSDYNVTKFVCQLSR